MLAAKAMLKLLQLISHSISAEGEKTIQRKREKTEYEGVQNEEDTGPLNDFI